MSGRPLSLLATGRQCLALLNRKSRMQLSFLALAILASTALETLGLSLVLPLLQFMADPQSVSENPTVDFIRSLLPVGRGNSELLIGFVFLIAAMYGIKNLLLLGVIHTQFTIIFNNERDFSIRLFNSYLGRPFTEMLGRNSASLIRNVRDVVATAFKGVIMGFINIATEGLMIAAILAVLIYVQPVSAMIAIVVLIPGAVIYQWITRPVLYRLGVGELEATRAIIKAVQEGMHSLKSTKVFGRESYFGNRFQNAKEASRVIAIKTNTIHQTPRLWFETVIIFAAASVIAALHVMTPESNKMPMMGLYAVAMLRLMPSINRLSQALNNIRNGSAALETLAAEYTESQERGLPADGPHDNDKLRSLKNIRFDDVTHVYPSKDAPSVRNVTFEITAGETVALVGPSGAGKTTVADLLLGLLEPAEGAITVNGYPLAHVAGQWRGLVGYVPQQVYISDDALRRNIAFALPDDVIDDARVIEALREAQISDLLETLPGGLDAPLGEHGRRLSVGQQQRIGIARALYDEPAFLVLDEATSALDVETENEISSVISALAGKLTIVIVAHRLSTVKNAGRIILMRDGRVDGIGPFGELIEKNENFARMVNLAKL